MNFIKFWLRLSCGNENQFYILVRDQPRKIHLKPCLSKKLRKGNL